ncbi:MAG: DUF4157 domain-containing protein [Acidobacteria bacterium]|nr:DUF4157 domain-containing protein [Acidobacteriota bacterium]
MESGKLRARWLRLFEASYGRSFKNVSAVVGVEAERVLRAAGALALAFDERTILFSKRLAALSERERLTIIGHELAHTVQLARGGSDAPEDLEREAWRASYAALSGQAFEIRGGARAGAKLPAVALVMDKAGQDYFTTFDTLDPLQITKIEMIKPLTYERILDLLMDARFEKESDFLIQAHGEPYGFAISIVPGQAAGKDSAAHTLRQMMSLAVLIAAYKAAGDDFAKLKAVMKDIMKVDPKPFPDETKAEIEREIFRQKKLIGIDSDDDILRVVKKMADVRQKQRGIIELRTCNMGVSPASLEFFREQFNANSLAAPNLYSAFGRARPDIGASALKNFIKNHPEKEGLVQVGSEQFGFTWQQVPNKFEVFTFSAALNQAVVKSWVTAFIMGGKKFQATDIPVHFLISRPALFPLDAKYKGRIIRVKRP